MSHPEQVAELDEKLAACIHVGESRAPQRGGKGRVHHPVVVEIRVAGVERRPRVQHVGEQQVQSHVLRVVQLYQ